MIDQNIELRSRSRFAWLRAMLEILVLSVLIIILLPLLVMLFAIAMFRLRKLRFCNHRPSIQILGVQIWNTTIDDAVAHIVEVIRGQGQSQPIFFVNAACLNGAANDPEYQAILNGPGSVLVDGIGVKLAGMLTDQPVRENVNGTDLFPRLCEALEHHRIQGGNFGRIYLLGACKEAAQGTADWIRKNYPDVEVVGVRDGYYKSEETEQVIEDIRQSKADLLFVAMGAPHQEKWIHKNLEQTGARVALGVGGLFDFYSGRIPRAPHWIRKLGFEWLHRLLQEPRRMAKRYLIGNATFLWKIFRHGTEYPGKEPPAVEIFSEAKESVDTEGHTDPVEVVAEKKIAEREVTEKESAEKEGTEKEVVGV